MFECCEHCGRQFERGPGFFLGSIYCNYGVTAFVILACYFSFYFTKLFPQNTLLWFLGTVSVLFPIWFFRYARSLWAGLDEYFDPTAGDK